MKITDMVEYIQARVLWKAGMWCPQCQELCAFDGRIVPDINVGFNGIFFGPSNGQSELFSKFPLSIQECRFHKE